LYRAVWAEVVLPFLAPWITLLILFEIVTGLLMLSRYPKIAAWGQLIM
jgi:hypothetical protein